MLDVQYTKIPNQRFPHQVVVREMPSRLAALFRRQPTERTFVTDCIVGGYEGDGWYEIPGFTKCYDREIVDAISARILQDAFTDG